MWSFAKTNYTKNLADLHEKTMEQISQKWR